MYYSYRILSQESPGVGVQFRTWSQELGVPRIIRTASLALAVVVVMVFRRAKFVTATLCCYQPVFLLACNATEEASPLLTSRDLNIDSTVAAKK